MNPQTTSVQARGSAASSPPARRSFLYAAIIGALSIVIYAIPLWKVWWNYFPYEDDFSLIYYSSPRYEGHPLDWVTLGMTRYFANDPKCNMNTWQLWRPLWNCTHYLEGLFSPSISGLHLMVINLLLLGATVALAFHIALRLGLLTPYALLATACFAFDPGWNRAMTHSTFRADTLAVFWGLASTALLLKAIRSAPSQIWSIVLWASIAAALGLACHEQSLLILICNSVLLLGFCWRKIPYSKIAGLVAIFLAPSLLLLLLRSIIGPPPAFLASRLGAPLNLQQIRYWIWAFFRLLRPTVNPWVMTVEWWLLTAINGCLVGCLALALYFRRRDLGREIVIVFGIAALGLAATYGDGEVRHRLFPHLWLFLGVAALWQQYERSGPRQPTLWAARGAAILIAIFCLSTHIGEIWGKRDALLLRNRVDRISFERIRHAVSSGAFERVLLVNDQLGLWSATAMLRVAGFAGPVEVTPSISTQLSYDFFSGSQSCPANIGSTADGRDVVLAARSPSTACLFQTYSLDVTCARREYRREGRSTDVRWTSCLDRTHPPAEATPCSPLEFEPRSPAGPGVLIVAWQDRYQPADIFPNSLPRYSGKAISATVGLP